jgi:phosphoglycolate phosphatase-like HAD superfamily hydrolase
VLIGLDFDNTIVRYDELFWRLATERGLLPGGVPASKRLIRDHLRRAGREDAWTALQGIAYGPRIAEAKPFDGVREFLAECRRSGVEVVVVSHKTRHPHAGPAYDLHAAARQFLRRHGLYDTGLSPEAVYLEPTREAKLARIGSLGCDLFVDDLPELLGDPAFPARTRKVLFDPAGPGERDRAWTRVSDWGELTEMVLGAERVP